MATIDEVHEYFQQPESVRRAMRLEDWLNAKRGDSKVDMLPTVNEEAEIRRNLGWALR